MNDGTSHLSPNRAVDRLVIQCRLPTAALVEYVNLCVNGRVKQFVVESSELQYGIENVSAAGLDLVIDPQRAAVTTDDRLVEVIRLALGLQQLGATVEVIGKLAERFPGAGRLPGNAIATLPAQPLTGYTHLTPSDLAEIHAALTQRPFPVDDVVPGKPLGKLFPCFVFEPAWGVHLRHRSGHEVAVHWVQVGYFDWHSIYMVNPASHLYDAWQEATPGAPVAEVSGWRRQRELPYWLGGLPERVKPDVFHWVERVTWAIEEYHSTRGGYNLQGLLECPFPGGVFEAHTDGTFTRRKN